MTTTKTIEKETPMCYDKININILVRIGGILCVLSHDEKKIGIYDACRHPY
jgi:hypothetical protein